MRQSRTVSRALKASALVQSMLIITSFYVVLTIPIPWIITESSRVFATSGSTASVSIGIVDSTWIVNPGGTFTVYVVVVNNENTQLENVDVYAYVFEGENVLNVGGMFSNKTTITLAPNENENLALEITIVENATPGVYNLRARAELPDNTTYDDTENIYVENEGIHLKMGPEPLIALAGSGVFVSATTANLTSDNLDNIEIFSHIFSGEEVVNESEWDGNRQENSLSAGEIRNFYFALKILENIDSGGYVLRTRLRLPDNTLVDDDRSLRIVSLAGIKRKLDALENGIIKRVENFLDLYYAGRGSDNLVRLNEIYANVAGPDDGNEWIEVYNTSQDNLGWAGVRIGGWKVVNNEGTLGMVPLGTILQPDEYYIFEGLSGLSETGENVWLINDNGEVIDHLEYTSTVEGKSLARMPNASDNWVDNAELTKGRNNDDNSEGAAYLPEIDLAEIENVARELRYLLIENAQELVLANVDAYEALQYINQHGSGITEQDAEGMTRYIQTYGKFPDNFRQELLERGLTEDNVLEMENFIKEHPENVMNGAPSLGLIYLREEYTKTIQAFIDTAAACLQIEVAANVEYQPQDAGLSGEQYVAELDNRWDTTSSDLAEARNWDNSLFEAMKAEDWQAAYDNSDNLMTFAENRALEIVDEIHLARSARVYFRENGTLDNVKLVADYELKFTKALDRFLYFYQKGLYFKMVTLAALNGDNEQALAEAANARNMPFTVDVGSLTWVSIENLLANPSEYDNKEVWVQGFTSNIQRKTTLDNAHYSLFDLTTYEGVGAGVDNTRYYRGENIAVRDNTIALWRFDENSGTAVYDETSNSNDGTVYSSPTELNVDENTLALWHFNEGTGTSAGDSSANNNGGTLVSGGPSWVSGKFENALLFENTGAAQYVRVPYTDSLNLENFMVEVWAKPNASYPTDLNGWRTFVRQDNPLGGTWDYIWILGYEEWNDLVAFEVKDDMGSTYKVQYPMSLSADTWYHIAGVKDGNNLKLYINGELKDTATFSGNWPAPSDIYIGGVSGVQLSGGAMEGFNGAIDEVRIENRTPMGTENYLVYNDANTPTIYTWSDGDLGSFDSDSTVETSPEGIKSFETKTNAGNWAGWGPHIGDENLSAYSGGYIKFWVKTPDNIKIEVEDTTANRGPLYIGNYGWDGTNTWQQISIPLSDFSGFDLEHVKHPFKGTIESSGTFYVDYVIWAPSDNSTSNEIAGDYDNNQELSTDGGTVALWHFNEEEGRILGDASANNNDGMLNGAFWAGVTGEDNSRYGYGLSFGGYNGYLSVPHSESLAPPEGLPDLSVEAWASIDSSTWGKQRIITKRTDVWPPDNGWDIYAEPATDPSKFDLVVVLKPATGDYWGTKVENASTFNQWTHIAVTYEGSSGTLKIYINGIEATQSVWSTGGSGNVVSAPDNLFIGSTDGDTNWLKGRVDEVRIENRVLSPVEIWGDARGGRATGRYGNALCLSGASGDYVSVPHSETLAPPGGFPELTVEAWVYGENITLDAEGSVIGKFQWDGADMDNGWYIKLENKSDVGNQENALDIVVAIAFGENDYTGATIWDAVAADEWTHIAFTYKGSDNTLRIYVNTVEETVDSWWHTGSGGNVASSTEDLFMGSEHGTQTWFKGRIDELRIENRILILDEIAAHASGYEFAGYLESAIYDAGAVVGWEDVSWVSTEPAGTGVVVKVRTGSSSRIDDSWSAWVSVDNGQTVGENSRFIQYRFDFLTTDENLTPSLQELRVRYSLKGQVTEWVQSDWSGGEGLELWSAQQRLRVYLEEQHIDLSQGAGENSYGVFRGRFYLSHEATGVPQLDMLWVKLFVDGEPVPTDTPECWELYEPWGAAGYVGSSSITRGWGWTTYFAEGIKGVSEGALLAAFVTLENAFKECNIWNWAMFFGGLICFSLGLGLLGLVGYVAYIGGGVIAEVGLGGCFTTAIGAWGMAEAMKDNEESLADWSATGSSGVESTLVAYWRFDEGSGNIAHDETNYHNDGTLVGNPQWVEGKSDKALRFDGIDDYVVVPDSSSLDITSQITLEAWVYPMSFAAGEDPDWADAIIVKGDDDQIGHYGLYIGGGTAPYGRDPQFKIRDIENNEVLLRLGESYTMEPNTWYHLVATYDGSYMRIYVNGKLEGQRALGTQIGSNDGNLYTGVHPHSLTQYEYHFDGIIDEVRITDIALAP